MSGYEVYPEYRDSGVEWLLPIPSQWRVRRVKEILDLKKEVVGNNSNNYQLLSLTLDGIVKRYISDGGKLPTDFDTYQIVDESDLVFCLFDIDETPRTVGLSHFRGMITGAYSVYQCIKETLSSYIFYYFLHIDSFKGLRPFYTGLRKVVRSQTFSTISIPFPTLGEQKIIANFLDHETTKIDTLIEKQQQLIKLLKEKRQAVISHAVTKGLNPDAPMKDSGVEWLGEVPEHWEVLKLKYFAQMQGGFAFSSEEFKTDGVQLLRIGNVYLNRLALHRQPVFVDSSLIDSYQDYVVNSGDILMSLTGTLGKTDYGYAVSVEEDGPFLLNQRLARITPANGTMDRGFLLFTIRSTAYLNQLYSLPSGTKQANLSNDDVLGITIAAPSCREEQRRIASYIGDVLRRVNTLVSRAESAIELSRERRTALISAAVTGKIDVRNWQPPADTSTPSMDA